MKRKSYRNIDVDKLNTRDRTLPPRTQKKRCDSTCPHLVFSKKSSDLHAHCMKYLVPLDSRFHDTYPQIDRHSSCLRDFPPEEAP